MLDMMRKDKRPLPTCPKCGASAALVVRNQHWYCVKCRRDLGHTYSLALDLRPRRLAVV